MEQAQSQRIILGVTGGMIIASALRGGTNFVNELGAGGDPSEVIIDVWIDALKGYLGPVAAGILLLGLTLMGREMARIAAMIAILIAIGLLLRDGGAVIELLVRVVRG